MAMENKNEAGSTWLRPFRSCLPSPVKRARVRNAIRRRCALACSPRVRRAAFREGSRFNWSRVFVFRRRTHGRVRDQLNRQLRAGLLSWPARSLFSLIDSRRKCEAPRTRTPRPGHPAGSGANFPPGASSSGSRFLSASFARPPAPSSPRAHQSNCAFQKLHLAPYKCARAKVEPRASKGGTMSTRSQCPAIDTRGPNCPLHSIHSDSSISRRIRSRSKREVRWCVRFMI